MDLACSTRSLTNNSSAGCVVFLQVIDGVIPVSPLVGNGDNGNKVIPATPHIINAPTAQETNVTKEPSTSGKIQANGTGAKKDSH